jgi:hypothetical protein
VKIAQPRHDSDCVAATLASVLELPIEDVPDFWPKKSGAVRQYENVRRWLAGRGYHWYFSTYGGDNCPALVDFVNEKREVGSSFPPRGYWFAQISSIDRLRDSDPNHVVVMRDRRLVYNPGGTVKQALADRRWFIIGYYLLVPLDPAQTA